MRRKKPNALYVSNSMYRITINGNNKPFVTVITKPAVVTVLSLRAVIILSLLDVSRNSLIDNGRYTIAQ